MADAVVRFEQAKNAPNNEFDFETISPNEFKTDNKTNLVGAGQILAVGQIAKQVSSGVLSRVGNVTGNTSIAEDIQFGLGLASDIGTIAGGFSVGGPVGGVVAIGVVGIQRGFQAYDIKLSNERSNIDAFESRRRTIKIDVEKRSEFR